MNVNLIKIKFLGLPRRVKQILMMSNDFCIVLLSVFIAWWIRNESLFNLTFPQLWVLLISLVLTLIIFKAMGIYTNIMRASGFMTLFNLSKAVGIYTVLYALIFCEVGVEGVPRSIGILQPIILVCGVISSRILIRFWFSDIVFTKSSNDVSRVLIYGAGSAGQQLALGLSLTSEVKIFGFLDDKSSLHGHSINGITVFDPAELGILIPQKNITQILVALPSVSRARRQKIFERLITFNVPVRILPGLLDLTNGRVQLSDLKKLDIEDLLGREPVPPIKELFSKNITDKVVMVTGAGGSIGSELCRQIVNASPSRLLLVELSEFALYSINEELKEVIKNTDITLIPLLADVRNENRIAEIMRSWQPHVIFHAAAYKHVPIVEKNPTEGLRNNVLGTLNMAQLAIKHGVKNFVFISTDKAVRPTNIMGASKRLAELILQALANYIDDAINVQSPKTCFSIVRFGNVLASSGSVVNLFKEQIQKGGPITLTDEQVTRYFMTIQEAAQLVIQAGAMADEDDDEFAYVFLLNMGESVKIIDLAKKMVELSNLKIRDANNPEGDIAIEVTGLRPGEKLFEELLIGSNSRPTMHSRIMKAQEDFIPWIDLEQTLKEFTRALEMSNLPKLVELLKSLVSGYKPEKEIADLVWKELNSSSIEIKEAQGVKV